MEIWTRLIEGQNLKLRCRCFATFFCCDTMIVFFRGVAVWTVPQCRPHYYTLNPYGTVIHFFTLFFKSRKKTNLLYFLNNVFQYSKIRTRKRNAKKSIKTEKKLESSPFWNPESTELKSGIQYSESGIHRVESRIQDCHGFPYMGRNERTQLASQFPRS